MVWFNTRNFVTKKPCCKLKNCHIEICNMKRVISCYAIKLELLPEFQVYPVFHVNFVKTAITHLHYLNHILPSRPLIEINKKTEYEVLAIVNFRIFGKAKRL